MKIINIYIKKNLEQLINWDHESLFLRIYY